MVSTKDGMRWLHLILDLHHHGALVELRLLSGRTAKRAIARLVRGSGLDIVIVRAFQKGWGQARRPDGPPRGRTKGCRRLRAGIAGDRPPDQRARVCSILCFWFEPSEPSTISLIMASWLSVRDITSVSMS